MAIERNIVLIGAGIMSATLGVMIKKLMPDAQINIYERLDLVGAESSDAWNNAGTGHSAFCELNYTPLKDGKVDVSKALSIAEQFEVSKQFWSYLKIHDELPSAMSFINDIPHMSLVWGDDNVDFLKKRYEAMVQHPIFQDMEYADDPSKIQEWIPLMMEGRTNEHAIAATQMDVGTDVNFGAITRHLINYLDSCDNVEVHLGHHVSDLTKQKDGRWLIDIEDRDTGEERDVLCNYVFIGAGGGSLPLLEKSDVPEGRGYGGFPVSGQFLKCINPAIIARHEAKVYGLAAVGSPPMSVPHLDTRILDGERSLLFGPYAGFSTKFLKNGSYFDLPLSIEIHNVWPMLSAGAQNIPLTKYLIEQVMQDKEDRFEYLQTYYPNAKIEDWELTVAGQRVQIIKGDKKEGGKLQFGTEIVCAHDGSISALLGASPGASTSVSIMLDVLKLMFPDKIETRDWHSKLQEMIPSYRTSLNDNRELCLKTRERTSEILKLED